MQNPDILKLISSRLSGTESEKEKNLLDEWIGISIENSILYDKIKQTWEEGGKPLLAIKERLSKKYIVRGLIKETIGSLVGFGVGLWVSNSFTHYVRERRSIRNLFGIFGRKKQVVNDIPEWVQFGISVFLGFIVLEFINYFFQTKSHIRIWHFVIKNKKKV